MKKYLSIFLCIFGITVAEAASVLTYADARKEAKESGSDVLVLCVGSGWMHDTDRLTKKFKQIAMRYTQSDVIWAVYDMKRELDDKGRKALGTLPLEIYGYPAWIYMDAKGRPLWHDESIESKDLLKLPLFVKALVPKRKKRDAELKKIGKFSGIDGIEKAEMIGHALDPILSPVIERFPFVTVGKYMNGYRGLIDQIKKFNPSDRYGYYFKFTFNYLKIVEEIINKNCDAKKFDDNYQYIAKKLSYRVLTPKQRQQLIVFKFTTALRENKLDQALKYLDDAIEVAPRSSFAENCRRVKKYYSEPVVLEKMHWNPEDNRPRWTEMIVDITSVVKDYGSYTLEFKHTGGWTKFRNPKIMINQEIVADMEGEKTNFQFRLKDRPANLVYLHVEELGTGWFAGQGDIIIKKKP